MNCKPGDIAYVAHAGRNGGSNSRCDCHINKIVKCQFWEFSGEYMWIIDPPLEACSHSLGRKIEAMADRLLKPLEGLNEDSEKQNSMQEMPRDNRVPSPA